MNIFKETLSTLKQVGPFLYPTCLVLALADQTLTKIIQNQLMSPKGAGALIWVFALLAFFLSILQPLLITLLVSFALKTGNKSLYFFFQKYFQQTLIEGLRATGKSLSWGLLFILPGIMRAFYYLFVPFVVVFDPAYDKGEVDALERSMTQVKERFFHVVGVIIFFSGGIPLALVGFDQYRVIWNHPIISLFIVFVEMIISILLVLNLYKQWEQSNGTHV